MTRQCTVQGCRSSVRSPWSPICPKHRKALGRHGHPLQTAIKAPEVAPFVKLIAKRQADNANNEAWAILRRRWSLMVEAAQAISASVSAGNPYVREEAQAAQLLLTVAGAADADAVARAAMSVGMHAQADPKRYRSDGAVVYQMARKVLRLAPQSIGRYWCNKTRTSRTVRRDIPPRVLHRIAVRLNEAYGGAAAQLWAIEQARVPPAEAERRQLGNALSDLKG